ncbi:unnamed protein product [Oppiella nova]|uniref:Uncharacterized protein n=1 Tax=Oppiella nova TaxID=334625 RepID=A0A7R9QSH5_9ACAR|nr:unnamed protein product [Oppiella nova]CAG2174066.1 unnamed protein product [Oppiella nova]
MSRLWDDDEPDEIVEMSIQPLPRHQLVEMAPDQLVEFEGKQQESMIRQTLQFADQMKSCEKIVEAAYTVADYTPPFQNDLQSQFWTQTVS